MRNPRYPAVKVALAFWFGMVPLAWLADSVPSFEGPRSVVGPWMLLVLMSAPLLFSAAFSLAAVRLPAVDAASTQPGPSAGDDPDPLAADEAAADDGEDASLEIAR